jgi:flagellar motor switch protein FliM
MKFQDQAATSGLAPAELAALLGPPASVVLPAASQFAHDSLPPEWRTVGDEFARALAIRLRPLIRAAVRVTVAAATRITAESVTTDGDPQAMTQFWQTASSPEPLALILSPRLVATFVDRMLGGRSTPANEAAARPRTLTDVDHRIARRLLDAAQASLEELSGTDTTRLELTPSEVHSVAEAWLPEHPLIRLTWELQFAQGGGHLDLLLPQEIAEECIAPATISRGERTPLDSPPVVHPPKPTLIVAELAQVQLSRADFSELAVGDVLLTNAQPGEPLQVFVDGQLRFQAAGGQIAGRKAIRLTQVCGNSSRRKSTESLADARAEWDDS